ncbi:unnamed protein product [Peniophora sp. CBMAI 1063]|nr:unnamed protein product [Peniophora sp. CBMAI 1063]
MSAEVLPKGFQLLDGSNWPSWSAAMKDLLQTKKVWRYASGERKPPRDPRFDYSVKTETDKDSGVTSTVDMSTPKSAKDLAKLTQEVLDAYDSAQNSWLESDDAAFGLIKAGCVRSIRDAVATERTSEAAWDELEERYGTPGTLQIFTQFENYMSHVFTEDKELSKQFAALDDLYNQLKDSEIQIPDVLHGYILLRALPDSYADTRSIIINSFTNLENATSLVVKQRILGEEARRKAPGPGSVPSVSAQRAQAAQTCSYCGKSGHTEKTCFKKRGDEKRKKKGKGKDKGKEGGGNGGKSLSSMEAEAAPSTPVPSSNTMAASWYTTRDSKARWMIDSGSSDHITPHRADFIEYTPLSTPGKITLGEAQASMPYVGIGTVKGFTMVEGNRVDITLSRVLHAPAAANRYISGTTLIDRGFSLAMSGSVCRIHQGDDVFGIARRHQKFYWLQLEPLPSLSALAKAKAVSPDIAHGRFAHVSYGTLGRFKPENVHGIEIDLHGDHTLPCHGCQLGKSRRKHRGISSTRATRVLYRVHTDLMGPFHVRSRQGYIYVATFLDDYSGLGQIWYLKAKDDFPDAFEEFLARAQTETGQKLVYLRSDRGGEYTSNEFEARLRELGVQHETSVPYTPAQNGRAERFGQTILYKALAMLHHAGLALYFWQYAFDAALHVYNRTPMRRLGWKTPSELYTGNVPDVSHFRVFGCQAYVHVVKKKRKKLEKHARSDCSFLGYEPNSKGWRFYDHDTRSVVFSDEAEFNETTFKSRTAAPGRAPAPLPQIRISDLLEVSPELDEGPAPVASVPTKTDPAPVTADAPRGGDNPEEVPLPPSPLTPLSSRSSSPEPATESHGPRRSTRPGKGQHGHGPGYMYGVKMVTLTYLDASSAPSISSIVDMGMAKIPKSYRDAVKSEFWDKWLEAIRYELAQLAAHGTWEVVDRPNGVNVVKCRWVFAIKHDGRFRARLVAKGFTQVFGEDYFETFSPVARFETLRFLLALAARHDWHLVGLDVKSAFLYGDLDEEIYMELPEGFEGQQGTAGKVAKLRKALYGLKQASRVWNEQIDAALKELGYARTYADTSIYVYRRQAGNTTCILVLYVDDMALMGNNRAELDRIKSALQSKYEMTDAGDLAHFIGLRISRDRGSRTLEIDQSAYLAEVLQRFGMADATPVRTPLPAGLVLQKSTEPVDYERRKLYQSIVGSLMWAAIASRPDFAYHVTRLSQYCSNPSSDHLAAVKHVLKYVKGTVDLRLRYDGRAERLDLHGYCDSNHAEDRDDRHSISAFVFMMSGGAIAWLSRKQSIVAQSTAEAEYIAMAEAAKQIQWYTNLCEELGLPDPTPVNLQCDNRAALLTATNPVVGRNMKHVHLRYHYIREAIESRLVKAVPVPSADNLADLLTKALTADTLSQLSGRLGMIRVPEP